ncbi:MAG: radical SAM protein [Paludibacteraceae bacterium]|nr:radical SAM protein [Paludibacteraceae bacterium]
MKKFRKIYININSICNCKCVNCILSEDSRKMHDELSIDEINNLVDSIPQITDNQHYNIAEVSGGEPTLHKHFIEIVKILQSAKTKGHLHKIALLTNGLTASNKAFCSDISQYIDDVVITLYDTNPINHDWFTNVSGSFVDKIAAIDNFLECGVNVHIKLLVIRPSYQRLPEIAEFINQKWGNKVHVAINGTHYTGDAHRNNDVLFIKNQNAKPYIEKALDILIMNKTIVSVFFPLCILDPIYWQYSPRGFKDVIDASLSISPKYKIGKADRLLDEFIHRNDVCESCLLVERCNWPWKRYCEILDEQEIIEAKNNMYKNIIN